MARSEFDETIHPDYDPMGIVDGNRSDSGRNRAKLPKLDYQVGRITLPGEGAEKRVWVAPYDGGFLAMSLDQETRYGFLLPDQVTLIGTRGDVWDRMRQKGSGLVP